MEEQLMMIINMHSKRQKYDILLLLTCYNQTMKYISNISLIAKFKFEKNNVQNVIVPDC
jgi:hypothetical protein